MKGSKKGGKKGGYGKKSYYGCKKAYYDYYGATKQKTAAKIQKK